MKDTSEFETEYINPTFLDSQNPDGMSGFFDNYFLPATQNIQNELSAFHPEHFTDLEFGQQQILQAQQGGPEFTVPNAPGHVSRPLHEPPLV